MPDPTADEIAALIADARTRGIDLTNPPYVTDRDLIAKLADALEVLAAEKRAHDRAMRIARVVENPTDDERREIGNTAIEEGAFAHDAGLSDDEADKKAGRSVLELLIALAEAKEPDHE